jgi:hypothetical protein
LRTKKDRIVNALLILLFLAIMGGSAYFIFKTMTHWNIKGLGESRRIFRRENIARRSAYDRSGMQNDGAGPMDRL